MVATPAARSSPRAGAHRLASIPGHPALGVHLKTERAFDLAGGGEAPGGQRCEFPVQLAAWTSARASYARTSPIAFAGGLARFKKPEAERGLSAPGARRHVGCTLGRRATECDPADAPGESPATVAASRRSIVAGATWRARRDGGPRRAALGNLRRRRARRARPRFPARGGRRLPPLDSSPDATWVRAGTMSHGTRPRAFSPGDGRGNPPATVAPPAPRSSPGARVGYVPGGRPTACGAFPATTFPSIFFFAHVRSHARGFECGKHPVVPKGDSADANAGSVVDGIGDGCKHRFE